MKESIKTLFESIKIGRYTAKNRIFMAPMSRYRALEGDINPEITTTYYAQRATAGLIVAESTKINKGSGGINCPGIYNKEQVASWKKVTDAVHRKGGLIFLQLWHSGRASHSSILPEDCEVVAPSAIPSTEQVMTFDGMQTPTPPRALTTKEIQELRDDFEKANEYALQAGFDGVEIHAAGGFLIDSFLQESTNHRTDAYGGSLENRFRFLSEVLDDAINVWGADRVGIKLSPVSAYNNMGEGDVLTTFKYVISQLNTCNIAFLEINEEMPFSTLTEEKRAIINELQSLWDGVYIANGNYTAESGAARIEQEKASAISYGRFFIANPDLVERFRQDSLMNELDVQKFYGGDHKGYTDYPFLTENALINK
ncbi:alkene reductase [Aquimarina algiphila]|uniref:alkene reductase n=1 Tax=Aquimarina algiphila TaxID=2047982 RepID=UPI00232FB52A|nr:alkene reductase [Aquimarina algiphila]